MCSIEKVGDELTAGADQLATWAQTRGSFFLQPDAVLLPSLQVVSTWATGGGFEQAAVNTFLQVADSYLVAHAHAHGQTVVTQEIVSTSTERIKVPHACLALGVRYTTPYEMLRVEHARFVLGARPTGVCPIFGVTAVAMVSCC